MEKRRPQRARRGEETPAKAAVREVGEQQRVGQRAVAQAAAARECLAVRVAEWSADRYADAATLTIDSRGARSR